MHLFLQSDASDKIMEYFYQYKLLLPTYSSEYDTAKYEAVIIISICILAYLKDWKIIGIIFNSIIIYSAYNYLGLLSDLLVITSSPVDTKAYTESMHIRKLVEEASPMISAFILVTFVTTLTYFIPVLHKIYKNSLLGLWIEKQKTKLRNDLEK